MVKRTTGLQDQTKARNVIAVYWPTGPPDRTTGQESI